MLGRVLRPYHSILGAIGSTYKHPVEVLGEVRYGLNILLNTPVRFGANSIPVHNFGMFDTPTQNTPGMVPVYP